MHSLRDIFSRQIRSLSGLWVTKCLNEANTFPNSKKAIHMGNELPTAQILAPEVQLPKYVPCFRFVAMGLGLGRKRGECATSLVKWDKRALWHAKNGRNLIMAIYAFLTMTECIIMFVLANAKYPELTVASIDRFNRLLKMTNQARIMSFRRRIQCQRTLKHLHPCGTSRTLYEVHNS